MTHLGAPAMTAAHARRWAAAAVPWWVPRVVLVAGWVVAVVVAFIGDTTMCTPDKPSVCGPNPVLPWALVTLVATPVLLWWMPVVGCASGVLFAGLDIAFDNVRAAGIAFVVGAFMMLALAVGPLAVVLGLPFWLQILCVFLGGFLAVHGWARLSRKIRIEREALVVSRVFRVHRVPWPRLHGVRRGGDKLMVAWEPDVTMTIYSFDCDVIPDNPDASDGSSAAATAQRVGATMVRQLDLVLAAGDPGTPSTARLGSGVLVAAGYVIIVLATWWHSSTP